MKSQVKLIRGFGINDAEYVVQKFETISKPGEKRRRKAVWACPAYRAWNDLIKRCYDKKCDPAYEGCSVSDEWKFFTEFKKWHDTNYVQGWYLDKDVLFIGNKIYGPTTCAYVPSYINNLVGSHRGSRNDYPLSVYLFDSNLKNPYMAQIVSLKKYKYLGYYPTPMLAHRAWQSAKIESIESTITSYSKEPRFRTDVAEALLGRVWKIRLDLVNNFETLYF